MYAFIENNKINGTGQCKCLDENTKNKDITEEEYNLIQEKGNNYFIYKDGELIVNPEYEEEVAKQEKEKRKGEILAELDQLDLKSIRALRAGEEDRLAELEAQAVELRNELNALN